MKYIKNFTLVLLLSSLSLNLSAQTLPLLNGQMPNEKALTIARSLSPSINGPETARIFTTSTYEIDELSSQFNYSFNWKITGGYIVDGPKRPQASNSITVYWTAIQHPSIAVEVMYTTGDKHYSLYKGIQIENSTSDNDFAAHKRYNSPLSRGALKTSPNPAHSGQEIEVSAPSQLGNMQYRLLSVTGQTIREWKDTEGRFYISTNDLSTGVYLLQAEGEQYSQTKKIIIID